MPVNLDKPHLWKGDVARSVDMYNDWFMHFAPATTVYDWQWMRRWLLARESDIEAKCRLIRAEVAAVALEASLLMQDS